MEPYPAIALVTFLVAYGTLATEKINRTIVVVAGSLVLLVTGVLTLAEAINYVNWETIGLLFGMFIIVVVLSDAGFFSYVAFILAKRLDYNPRTMLIVFPLLAGLLASFVNSITVMLFLAAITAPWRGPCRRTASFCGTTRLAAAWSRRPPSPTASST